MNELKLTIDLEEFSAGLTAHLFVDGFSGFGCGWFNLSEIQEFCASLEKLALSMKGKSELHGGQSNSDGTDYLEKLGLRSYVVSKNGIIGMHVSLAEPSESFCRKEEILTVSGELQAEVQSILNFTNQLKRLCKGEVKEAILSGKQ